MFLAEIQAYRTGMLGEEIIVGAWGVRLGAASRTIWRCCQDPKIDETHGDTPLVVMARDAAAGMRPRMTSAGRLGAVRLKTSKPQHQNDIYQYTSFQAISRGPR